MTVGDHLGVGDQDLSKAIYASTGIVDAVLELLEHTDPFGLKDSRLSIAIHRWPLPTGLEFSRKAVEVLVDSLTRVTDASGFPGTDRWNGWDNEKRVRWWIGRVGSLTSVLVSYPAVFGAVAKVVPLREFLGFAHQLILLSAVLRVYEVDDRYRQTDALISVLCRREVDSSVLLRDSSDRRPRVAVPRSPAAVAGEIWSLKKTYDAVVDALAERPSPPQPWKFLAMVPLIGAPATYVGERFALNRAADQMVERLTTAVTS